MSWLFAGGRILDFILLAMLVEAGVLWGIYRRFGRGLAPAALLPTIGSGFFVMLSMRLALGGAAWTLVALALLGALALHLVDLTVRWR
jgi:hypothetical protein